MFREISSLQNPLIKHLVRLRQNSDYRYNSQTILVEGKKIVNELSEILTPRVLIATDEHLVPKNAPAPNVLIATDAIVRKISGLLNPEGVLAEFPMPQAHSLKGMKKIIAIDSINDPGNLGSILRTALALGWEGAFIVGESCDPYNEKAIRAARGATLKLPIQQGSWQDLEKLISDNKLLPLAADIMGKSPQDFDNNAPTLLLLSNEAHGLSDQAEKICQKISIPLLGNMESLNVAAAGAILMYALK